MLRIVIADDHDLFREGLANLLRSKDDIEVSGEARTGCQLINYVDAQRPDVVLIDPRLQEPCGFKAMEHISTHYPSIPIVVLTTDSDEAKAIQAIRAGARSYLLKSTTSSEVIRTVRLAAVGGSTIDPNLAPSVMREFQRLLKAAPATMPQDFTEREVQLLKLLARGQTNRQIAQDMDLAESTIKNNLSALFHRIGVRDRTQAVLYAFQHGIVGLPTNHRSRRQ